MNDAITKKGSKRLPPFVQAACLVPEALYQAYLVVMNVPFPFHLLQLQLNTSISIYRFPQTHIKEKLRSMTPT